MADGSTIEWLARPGTRPATWNPVRGCTRVSEGCRGCYAEGMAARFSKPGMWGHGFAEMKAGNPRWTGKVALIEDQLTLPLRWREPRTIFANSTSDLFHERLPDEAIDRISAVMALCPQHTFIVLTKRPQRMHDYVAAVGAGHRSITLSARAILDPENRMLKAAAYHADEVNKALLSGPLPNVWLGTSIEDQATADERVPLLLDTPAAIRFVSAEPLLGRIRTDGWLRSKPHDATLNWVIVGGESGRNARPMHPDWARSLRDQCVAAGVPFFFKQWGGWISVYDRQRDDPDWRRCSEVERQTPDGRWLNLAGGQGFHGEWVNRMARVGKIAAGDLLDGREWHQWPEAASNLPLEGRSKAAQPASGGGL